MFGNDTGETAFFNIIESNGAEFQNLSGVEPPLISMGKSVESLMLEAAVMKDERRVGTTSGRDAFIFSEEIRPPEMKIHAPVGKTIDETDDTTNETTTTNSAELETTEEDDMTEIQKILAEFTNIDGVHTACLVGRDGFLLDSLARTGIDAEMIGAIASSGFGSAEAMGTQLGQGSLRMTMLEYAEGPVMFAPVGDEAFLVIVADKDTNLGWIRIAIKKNSAKIEKVAF
jgi:hypothetical protein